MSNKYTPEDAASDTYSSAREVSRAWEDARNDEDASPKLPNLVEKSVRKTIKEALESDK